VLQGPPEGGFWRRRPGDAQPGQRGLISISGPFGDRGERARPGQRRAHRQAHNGRQPVADSPAAPRIGDPGQHRQQARAVPGQRLREISQVADGRVSQ
jgi:hypothetical protein